MNEDPDPMNTPALNISHVSITLGNFVIGNADFRVDSGTFLGIIGPNGAGKSTLMRLMAGLLIPGSGAVELAGRPLTGYSREEVARNIGYVPQGVDLEFPFTVREVVTMGRYAHREGVFSTDPQGGKTVHAALQWMDLTALEHRPYTQLSGGEKQRTIIASTLAQEPHLLLLDEPTSALDLKHQQAIYRILGRLCSEEGKTIVIVTHDINLAAQFCSRLILMDRGRIIADGLPDDVLKFRVIQEVYGVKVYIDVNPFTKSIYILPYDTR